jgi:hypothetical protein
MEGDAGGVRAITICYYHKSVVYYSRALADSCRTGMLFSSGDYPRTLSSILSGEGLDEGEQGSIAVIVFVLVSSRLPSPQYRH